MDIQRELEAAFTRLIDQPWGRKEHADWHPAIDLHEVEDAYFLLADLPGVDPKDIELNVTAKTITLCGSRASLRQIKTPLRAITERSTGRFFRTFTVSSEIDRDAVTSDYQNGIYEAHLPKSKACRA